MEGDAEPIKKLLNESGGHRHQRIPPTERHGRVHTSTVTVAAFELKDEVEWKLNDSDIQVFTTKDSGPGGQHRNKTESCVIMRHLPTGIEAKAAEKSQFQNRKTARAVLEARVKSYYEEIGRRNEAQERKEKVGSGMRGDKIRTYRQQDGVVIDHRTNRKFRFVDIQNGRLDF